jgi:Protein of unknown function (DUF3300)
MCTCSLVPCSVARTGLRIGAHLETHRPHVAGKRSETAPQQRTDIQARWLVAVLVAASGFAGTTVAQEPVPEAPAALPVLSAPELDQLLGPIALYPDPLIAQMLPAATYPLEIVKAARLVRASATAEQIDSQDWEPCVKAIAHYPNVIGMMDTSLDWTEQLGQAFMAQPDLVMQSVQRLRSLAREQGNLVDTPEEQVLVDDDLVRIVPANPQVIYVPVYEPAVVYYRRPSFFGAFVTFGIGMSIGAWLDLDCDWHDRHFYRPGWTWNHWREHIVVEHGHVVRVDRPHGGEREHAAVQWQRNERKPFLPPGRRVTRPGQFEPFRGRERVAVPRPLEPQPRVQMDRGRIPVPREPTHAFDPRQQDTQAERYSRRGAESQRGVPARPTEPPRAPAHPAPVKPVPPPRAHVMTPPVRVAPPPPAATAPPRPALTGGGPAAKRGAGSRGPGHD